MTDIIRMGESGKINRINTNFDMSNNTSITFTYTKPSGAVVVGVATIGDQTVTIDGVPVLANFWASYVFTAADLDEAGDYDVLVTYNNATTTPPTILLNNTPLTLVVRE